MAYNTSLSSAVSFYNSGNKDTAPSTRRVFARVTDIVSDSSHPDYELFGKSESLNGIRYRVLNDNEEIPDTTREDPFAFFGETFLKRIPLIDEIVEIVFKPGNSIEGSAYQERAYYTQPVGIWNNAHHNALPEKNQDKTEAVLGADVVELSSISSLQPFPGDVYIEGRLGQSLRFSGYKHPKNFFTNDSNNGSPFAIIRIGQREENDPFVEYVENINTDPSSIYITSDQVVPLTPSLVKDQDTYRSDKPVPFSIFQGNQIIIDSGRLVLHAKNDHLLLNSKLSTGIKAKTVNIDSTDYIGLDSPKIYLGVNATDPVVRGNKNLEVLTQIVDVLKRMSTNFKLATTPTQASAQLVATGQELLPLINSINLTPTLSTKVFTE